MIYACRTTTGGKGEIKKITVKYDSGGASKESDGGITNAKRGEGT